MKRQVTQSSGKGASQSRTRWSHRLRAWFYHHRDSARDSLQRLLAHAFSSVMTWLVIGIALALPVGLSVALDNARTVSSELDSPAQLSVFLRPEMSLEAATQLQNKLEARADVVTTRLLPREQALLEFQQLSGFGDVLLHLEENPLPNLIIVSPTNPRLGAEAATALQTQLKTLPGVGRVVLDMEWVQRLNSLLLLGQRIITALGLLLALSVLLIIGNTIRLAIENRREEIVIVKLVGGSDAFVRRPFLYTGIWYGLGGAVVSWSIISATLWWLEAPLQSLALLYQSGFRIQGLGFSGGLLLLALGAVLGVVGAWLAVSRHLTAIQPH